MSGSAHVIRRLASVMVTTGATALIVYAAVQLGIAGPSPITVADGAVAVAGNAVSQGRILTCPTTGCSASTCHGTDPSAPIPSRSQATPQTPSGSGRSGGAAHQSSIEAPSQTLLVCPETGCAATSCHATEGGSRAEDDQHRRRRTSIFG